MRGLLVKACTGTTGAGWYRCSLAARIRVGEADFRRPPGGRGSKAIGRGESSFKTRYPRDRVAGGLRSGFARLRIPGAWDFSAMAPPHPDASANRTGGRVPARDMPQPYGLAGGVASDQGLNAGQLWR
ncbi:hypothetical protein Pve01_38460 [Planomonospora venezuelensis]|nr:hypothetical protein Pve01_38460 [Planomonospora venezuelensis]